MPVGVGKSHLAMMISDWYSSKIDNTSKIDIITAGKILQDQYDETYDSIANLKGKENYSCSQYACDCLNHYGFIKSIGLIGWRVLRCNPWSHGGYDPAVKHSSHQ